MKKLLSKIVLPIKRPLLLAVLQIIFLVALLFTVNSWRHLEIILFLLLFIFIINNCVQQLRLSSKFKKHVKIDRHLQATFDAIGEGVVATDIAGNIERMSHIALALSGCNAEECVGKAFDEVFLLYENEPREVISNIIQKVLSGDRSLSRNDVFILTSHDGREYSVTLTCTPILSEVACIEGAVVAFRDITDSVMLEEQLRQSQKMESIGRLAGGIAHDFNNMIGAITGTAEVMMLQLDEDSTMRCYAKRILNTADKAAELTSRLLAFARKSKSGNMSFNLELAVDEALDIIERSIDKRISVETSYCGGGTIISGDPPAIENAIINLCINARDAMPDGGRIILTTEVKPMFDESSSSRHGCAPGNYVVLSVKDTGIGMTEEIKEKIFEPFFTTKDEGKGSGLGLAAVYGSVKEHGGFIEVDTEVGMGTTIMVYLPVIKGKAPERLSEDVQGAPLGSGTILLVDDEEFLRDAGTLLLSSLGYDVLLAENGEEAVDIYRQKKDEIDLVVLDMIMPVMNGEDAFNEMKKINNKVKVIIASGFAGETGMSRLLARGLLGFLRKPFNRNDIATLIADCLEEDDATNFHKLDDSV